MPDLEAVVVAMQQRNRVIVHDVKGLRAVCQNALHLSEKRDGDLDALVRGLEWAIQRAVAIEERLQSDLDG